VLDLAGYRLTPWATPHSVPSIGWVIDDGERRVAITGDTGAGFAASLAALGPLDLVVTECTWDDERAAMAAEQGHLCPRTLRDELAALAVVWREAPRVAVVHRHPEAEAAIVDALAAVPGVWLPAAGEVCQL
jgi:L-ascorbate metabolism protein UlaG (beta-lactamase superfamily)